MQHFTRRGFASAKRSRKREGNDQFEQLQATELYCPYCKRSMPVRERLLLVLPEGEKFEYLCARCGTSVGDKIAKGEQQPLLIV
jgi:DNA-directed RNA polymerase subunit RPC12/RpoP